MLAMAKRKPNVCNCVSMVCAPINYGYRANNLRKALDPFDVAGYMGFIYILPSVFTYIIPLVAGWAYGGMIFSDLFPGSRWWYYGGSCIGAISMFVVCTILFAIVFTPPKNLTW
jgi:hypothetical protein